jgi:hypothetical protein
MRQIVNLINTQRACRGLLLGAALLLVAPAGAEDIYKWIGDDNQVHYTQMPPPHGIKAIRIQRSDVPAVEETAEEAEVTDEPEQTVFDDTPGDQAEAEGDADANEDAQIAQALRENCSNARKNLESLNRGQVRYVDPDGKIIRLSEEERQQRIEEARAQIGVLCEN